MRAFSKRFAGLLPFRISGFAERHQHAWLKHLKKEEIDLGKGKRMLVKGGKFDAKYQITVPEDLNGVR